MNKPTGPTKEEQFRHHLRAIERAAAQFKVRHMNDTKWREVFEALLALGVSRPAYRLKAIYDGRADELIEPHIGFRVVGDSWVDSVYGPWRFAEIEWMEIPGQYVSSQRHSAQGSRTSQDVGPARQAIELLGRLRIIDADGGFRILGYER